MIQVSVFLVQIISGGLGEFVGPRADDRRANRSEVERWRKVIEEAGIKIE
jgi:hypothetical protein